VNKRADSGGGDFDVYLNRAVKMFKAHDKGNQLRFLPPTWEGATHYGLDIYVHYGIGPDRQTYLCLHKMKGEPCPICEERQKAARDGDDDYAKELEPKKRVLVYLIDRDAEKEGIQAWAMPQGTDLDIVKLTSDRRTGEVLSIDHPDDGFDVTFEKTGAGLKTRYEAPAIARRSSALGDDDWLDFAVNNPLPDQLVYYSYDHIRQEFGGSGEHRDPERQREAKRGADDLPSRDTGRGSDRGRDSEPARPVEPRWTWESVHELTGRELDDLIEDEKLDIKADDAKDDEDLADWICEEMELRKQEAPTTRGRVRVSGDDDGGGSVKDRFAEMRRGR
jgi:hypothetical protein